METKADDCLLHCGKEVVNEGKGGVRQGLGPGEKDEERKVTTFHTDLLSADGVQIQLQILE